MSVAGAMPAWRARSWLRAGRLRSATACVRLAAAVFDRAPSRPAAPAVCSMIPSARWKNWFSCLPFVHFFGQCEIWWTTKARVSTMLATKDNCNVAVVAQSSHGDWFGGQKNISPILFIKLTTSRDVASQSCLKLRIINTLCVGWDGAPSI